jgi:hypothetical protein
MKGRNKLLICESELMNMVQYYFDNNLFVKKENKVKSINQLCDNLSNNKDYFEITFEENSLTLDVSKYKREKDNVE